MNVTKSGKTLTIDGRTIEFEQRIGEVVTLDDRVIIRFRVSDFEVGDPMVGRNVIALDSNGNLLWRIPDTDVIMRDPDGSEAPAAYFNLRLRKDGKTIAIGTPDMTYELDPETGRRFGGTFHR